MLSLSKWANQDESHSSGRELLFDLQEPAPGRFDRGPVRTSEAANTGGKCGALESLEHPTVFATPLGPCLDRTCGIAPGHHAGLRPSTWSAWARTRAIVSLSSTRASNSSFSSDRNAPSVF